MELSCLDISYVVKEMQEFIGSKIEKIFQSDTNKRDLFFHMYTGSGKRNLRFILPGIVCAPKEKGVYPISPPGFAMFLRKYLDGAKITAVTQQGFDRIIAIGFSKRDQNYTLIVEMIPPGNMLLLDGDNRIINLLEAQQYKDRSLRGKQLYIAPPAQFNIIEESEEMIARRIVEVTRDSIVTTLATRMGLGGMYAEEVCVMAQVDKHRNDLDKDEISRVAKAVKDLTMRPLVAHADKNRAYPFKPLSRETTPCDETSLLAAVNQFMHDDVTMTKLEIRQREKASPRTKLSSLIDAQKKQIESLEENARTEQRKGELIYEQYALVKTAMDIAKETRVKKWNVTQALKDTEGFISYNDNTGEMELELKETE